MLILLAFAIGIVAGLRAMLVPAALAWTAYLGWIDLSGSWLAWLAHPWAPWIATLLAAGELVADKLPTTPSRKQPPAFAARIAMGALGGAAIGIAGGALWLGLAAGAIGGIAGTLGGAAIRARLAVALGRDLPAALIEDAAGIALAVAVLSAAA